MKIKECLACKLREKDTIEFVAMVSCSAHEMESTKDAWENFWDDCDSGSDYTNFDRAFLEHVYKDHEEDLDNLGCKVSTIYNVTMNELREKSKSIVAKEVF